MLNDQAKDAQGRRALVTGGVNGIGWETCRLLASLGCRIALADIDGEAAKARVAELGASHVAIQVDLTDRAAASALPSRAAAAMGGLDVIINNAGVTDTSGQPLVELPEPAFKRLVDLNLSGVEAICEAALSVLPRGSNIVNLASGASYRPLALRGPYSATKAGIVALTTAYSKLYASKDISVAAVAPGYTRTPLVEELIRNGRVDVEKVLSAIPLGRMAMPEDIASVIAFAASEAGGVLSGETVLVDGGGSAAPATANSSPQAGIANEGRIAAIGGDDALFKGMANDIAWITDSSGIFASGPLCAVIDMTALEKPVGASETLISMRETALKCAAHDARTSDFALLYVFGNGEDPATSAAVASGEMLARTIALEWAPSGVRVNALRWRSASRHGLDTLCLFLVSASAGMITGQAISASGPSTSVTG